MKNYIKKVGIIVLFILIILSYNVQAIDRKNINFKNISIEDGLSQAVVSYIYQDSDGYMWLATENGLNKYNGNYFKIYKNNSKDDNSLSNNIITGIAEDDERNLWISTASGVNKLNLDTEKIERYLISEKDKKYSNSVVDEIIIDSKGRIWACTSRGLNLYNKESDSFKLIESELLLDKEVQDLTEDEDGNLWLATKYGVFIYSPENETTIELDEGLWSNKEKNVTTITYDDNKIYIGTKLKGLIIINLKDNSIKKYEKGRDGISLPSNYIRDIYVEKNGQKWIATDSGLVLFDEVNETFYTINSNDSKNSLCDNNIISIYQDKTGMMWIGTFNGISRFVSSNPFKIYRNNQYDENSLSSSSVCGIYEDDDGLIWVGTFNSGVNIINREQNIVTRLYAGDDNKSLSSDRVRDITGNKNEIYIATDNGLNVYDKKTNTIRVYNKNYEESPYNNEIRSLYVDKNESLWIGTNGGLFRLSQGSEYKSYVKIFEENGIYEKIINCIYEDIDGVIWVGLANEGGLIRLNTKTDEITRFTSEDNRKFNLSSNNVRSIAEDYLGNLWIGTQAGLNKLNKYTQEIDIFYENMGLSNDFIYGILVDNKNNIWVSTNYGISMFDQKMNIFIRYYESDGLASNEHNGFSYHKGKNGLLYFGGINGLTEINIDDISRIVNEDIEVKVNYLETSNGVEIKEKNNFVLDYNSRSLYVEFFVPEYISEKQLQYFYKIDGIDKDWVFSKNEYYARYSNLEPGKYKMKIMARTYSGKVTDIKEISFFVKNSRFRTPIAYSIYLILIIIIIMIYFRNIKILESLVVKRTIESEKKLEENIQLYKKLIEAETYKNNYFVNLSHELRTPLNVIISVEQLIRSLTKDGKRIDDDKLQSYMHALKNNSNRLLNLINNIIDTSKIEAGEYRIYSEQIDVVSTVEDTALEMVELAKSKDINLVIDPEMEEYMITFNKIDLERCITNLVGNAIKFTDNGGMIIVKIRELERYIMISIKDNGIGIDKEFQESIFDRFGQVYNRATEEKGGSGLGLTLTKNLINLHGGEIRVVSKQGVGSQFIITIPKER